MRLSAARMTRAERYEDPEAAGRRHSGRQPQQRRVGERSRYRGQTGVVWPDAEAPQRLSVPEVAPIFEYDWEAAARRRPVGDECERVILHADRSVEARMSATRYYATGAAARVPEPWPEAPRREARPHLRVVKRRVPRRRLGLLAVAVGLVLVGAIIVAPMMMSSAVAGVEAAVGQAEAQQEQLAAETAALAAQISSLSSPQRVADEAVQLGLAPASEVSYISSGGPLLAGESDTTVAGR